MSKFKFSTLQTTAINKEPYLIKKEADICSDGLFFFYPICYLRSMPSALPLQMPCIWRDLRCASLCLYAPLPFALFALCPMLYALCFTVIKQPTIRPRRIFNNTITCFLPHLPRTIDHLATTSYDLSNTFIKIGYIDIHDPRSRHPGI